MNEKDTSVIPKGCYCYEHTGRMKTVFHEEIGQHIEVPEIKCCPYWSKRRDKPYQENGYCSYLESGDWDEPSAISLLWDQVKECGINDDIEEWEEVDKT
jgi:hypothetical protein